MPVSRRYSDRGVVVDGHVGGVVGRCVCDRLRVEEVTVGGRGCSCWIVRRMGDR